MKSFKIYGMIVLTSPVWLVIFVYLFSVITAKIMIAKYTDGE